MSKQGNATALEHGAKLTIFKEPIDAEFHGRAPVFGNVSVKESG
jgi:hypothetical protein